MNLEYTNQSLGSSGTGKITIESDDIVTQGYKDISGFYSKSKEKPAGHFKMVTKFVCKLWNY